MLIKYQALAGALRQKKHAIYILIGLDHYLLQESARLIKQAWYQDSDHKTLSVQTPSDWGMLFEEANSYSLFSDHTLLDACFDKKTFDASSKDAINTYLKHSNARCLIIIRAANVVAKQLQWANTHANLMIVQSAPFDSVALQRFIGEKLTSRAIRFEPSIPGLIQQYTQGNLLASMQLIEKLALIRQENEILTPSVVLEQLSDECDYQLYELADACLAQNAGKAIHLIQLSAQNRTEPTLILWLLTQEIRQLIQLSYLLAQRIPLATACSQLKIWPQRATLYAKMLTRLPRPILQQLLRTSQQTDELIKSNQSKQIWQRLEQLALSLCSDGSFDK